MEQEHHHHEHSHEGSEKALYAIAASVIIGSILISATIYHNFKSLAGTPGNTVAGGQQTTPPAAPEGPVEIKDRALQPTIGNKNAKVTVVEFADFQCPFCQRYFKETYPQLKTKYIDTGKIEYVFRHFPLSFHNNAEISGVAAECANLQGKFWPYHDLLFEKAQGDGTGLALADLKAYGSKLSLGSRFNQCLDNKSTLKTVQDDLAAGGQYGVSGTPTFFINGKKLVGALPLATFEQAIEEALK